MILDILILVGVGVLCIVGVVYSIRLRNTEKGCKPREMALNHNNVPRETFLARFLWYTILSKPKPLTPNESKSNYNQSKR